MRKLGLLLVVSILLFVFGCGTFVYELSQISPNQIDLSKETQTMTTTMPDRCRLYTKTYLSSVGDVRVVGDPLGLEPEQKLESLLASGLAKRLEPVRPAHRVGDDFLEGQAVVADPVGEVVPGEVGVHPEVLESEPLGGL